MATIGEFIKILKGAAVTFLTCCENITLIVVEGQRQVATSGTSRPTVESRTTESDAVWPSTRLCDFRVFDYIEIVAMLQRYIFQFVCSSLVRSYFSCTDSVSLSSTGISWQMGGGPPSTEQASSRCC